MQGLILSDVSIEVTFLTVEGGLVQGHGLCGVLRQARLLFYSSLIILTFLSLGCKQTNRNLAVFQMLYSTCFMVVSYFRFKSAIKPTDIL